MEFSFRTEAESIPLFFDPVQLEKVIRNLLSNALKFCGEKGRVEMAIAQDADQVFLSVIDNGMGIPLPKQGRLFNTFYQVNPVSGLMGSGVSKQPEESTYPPMPPLPGQYSILVIEDQDDIRQLLQESLDSHYRMICCDDGNKGLEIAFKELPDLIISDVMLPGMNGLVLSKALKQDLRSNHIPIILLTARAAREHQVSGYQTGADIYLTKPFSMQVLELNIRNLLRSRELLKQKFSQMIKLEPSQVVVESPDLAFLNKMIQIIEDHMDEVHFNIPHLTQEAGMSQPVLYKKIRALTGMSVNDFIKSIRLKRSAQLIIEKRYTIAQVAYMVGFNDPKYFSKEFKKQFGQSPSEYAGFTEQRQP